MSLRPSAANLLRRLRHLSPTVTAASLVRAASSLPNAGPKEFSGQYGFGGYTSSGHYSDAFKWIFLSGQAAIIIGINAVPALAEDVSTELNFDNDTSKADITGLRRIEDGSVVSNIHTSKWRIFTDNGRDLFLQGKLEEAEGFFLSAVQEAKAGFGERDPHVASAYNNLAELYRVKKAFERAEPLYLEAINVLEESFGPDDIRVGAALHNLGQFYLVQQKLEEAQSCYERALKIKRRVLGEAHADYADTMYHLGRVLYLQGKERDSEALIKDSIRILEDGGQGDSTICSRRLHYLAQIYMKSNQLTEAENVQRKILHAMELSKGWKSLDTVVAAEGLALTLQSVGSLREAQELLERCLEARKTLLPEDHIQIAANILYIARVKMLCYKQLMKTNMPEAFVELSTAKDHLGNSTRIARQVLVKLMKQKGSIQSSRASKETGKDGHAALMILLQSLNALVWLEITMQEVLDSREKQSSLIEAENALRQCISAYKEFGTERSNYDSPKVRAEYLSCLKLLHALISDGTAPDQKLRNDNLQELKDEIKRVEDEHSPNRKA